MGAGRKEPKLLNRLAPLPTVFARFAGGSGKSVSPLAAAVGSWTTILPVPEPERSMSFWKGFLVVELEVAAGAVDLEGCCAGSESDSESE